MIAVGIIVTAVVYAGPVAGLVWGGWQLWRWRKLNRPQPAPEQTTEATSGWQTYQDRPAPEVTDGPNDPSTVVEEPAAEIPPEVAAPTAHPVLATLAIILSLLVMIFVWPYMAEQQTKNHSTPAVTQTWQHSGR